MSPTSVVMSVVGTIVLTAAVTLSASAQYARPNSADASLLPMLMEAQHADRINAGLYTRSAPSLEHYYNFKPDELEDIIRRIKRGKKVPNDDIQHALDNSAASTFGTPVY